MLQTRHGESSVTTVVSVEKKNGMHLVYTMHFQFRIGYACHMTMSKISSGRSAYVWHNLRHTILASLYIIQETLNMILLNNVPVCKYSISEVMLWLWQIWTCLWLTWSYDRHKPGQTLSQKNIPGIYQVHRQEEQDMSNITYVKQLQKWLSSSYWSYIPRIIYFVWHMV